MLDRLLPNLVGGAGRTKSEGEYGGTRTTVLAPDIKGNARRPGMLPLPFGVVTLKEPDVGLPRSVPGVAFASLRGQIHDVGE